MSRPLTYEDAIKAGGKPLTLDDALAQGGTLIDDVPAEANTLQPPKPFSMFDPVGIEDTTGQVALKQVGALGQGGLDFFTSLPGFVTDLAESYSNPKKLIELTKGVVGGTVNLAEKAGRLAGQGLGELISPGSTTLPPPEAPQWNQDARETGALATSLGVVPAIKAVPKIPRLTNSAYQGTMDAAGRAVTATSDAVGGVLRKPVDVALKPFVEAPETTFLRTMKVSDPDFIKSTPTILDELKAAEQIGGTKFKNVGQMRTAADTNTLSYNEIMKDMIQPQANRVIPGSRKAVFDAVISEIPDDIRLNDHAQYLRLTKNANQILKGGDYTLGELNDLRKDLNATNSAYYGKNVAGQIVMEQGKRAMDLAKGKVVRDLLYDGLKRSGLGHDVMAREVNRRIGALIDFKVASDPLAVQSAIESGSSRAGRIMKGVGKLATPFESTKQYLSGDSLSLNRGLMDSLRRWESTPAPLGDVWPRGFRPSHGVPQPNPMDLTVHGRAAPRPNQPGLLQLPPPNPLYGEGTYQGGASIPPTQRPAPPMIDPITGKVIPRY